MATNDTENFLRCIASHLSTRRECRCVEYEVTITPDTVVMSPNYDVFPSLHNRRPEDKISVVYHVLSYHFCRSNLNLNPGVYKYIKSTTSNRRRWTRL